MARSPAENPRMSFLRRLNARGLLVPIVAAGLLIVIATGGALANRAAPAQGPSDGSEAEDQGAPPSADEVARVVDRLAEAGVDTDEDTVAALAADTGLGGAVRLLAWSDASGISVDEIADLRGGSEETSRWAGVALPGSSTPPIRSCTSTPGSARSWAGGTGATMPRVRTTSRHRSPPADERTGVRAKRREEAEHRYGGSEVVRQHVRQRR